MLIYAQLLLMAVFPVLVSGIMYYASQKTAFAKTSYVFKQIIIGLIFGILACLGTEYGVDVGGAVANARDGSILCAGLIFGAPAGVISGIIGGVYRYAAVLWGAGEFTQLACSLACIIAGIYGGLLRKFMFDNKKPGWIMGLAVGVIMEAIHLTLLFFTNIDQLQKVVSILKILSIPMFVSNGAAVSIALITVSLISRSIHKEARKFKSKRISQVIQSWLLAVVLLVFVVSSVFTYTRQNEVTKTDVKQLLVTNIDDVKSDIADLAADNRHIGKTGYIIVVDADDEIKSGLPEHIGKKLDDTTLNVPDDIQEMTVFETNAFGVEAFGMFTSSEGCQIIGIYPKEEALFNRDMVMYVNIFVEIILFAVLFAAIYILIKKIVVDNILKINSKLAQITGGNLNVTVDVNNNREFASLSDDINTTVDTLKRYIKEAEERINKELEYAKAIQASALPHLDNMLLERDEYEISAQMYTAKEVGGDFYDFYHIDNSHIAFTIADVSGKGIPAAMFMMSAKTMLKNMAEAGYSVDKAATMANDKLSENNDANMFVTVWMGILDLKTGHVEFINAGHNLPVIKRKNGDYEFLKCKAGLVMAGMEGYKYPLQEFDLEEGDTIFLYTDGVTEATDANTCLYGDDRLIDNLNAHCGGDITMESLIAKVKEDVDEFVKDAPQFDDITMVALKFEKKEV